MQKIILRLVVSGVIVTALILFSVLVLFRAPDHTATYAMLVDAYQTNGTIESMQAEMEDEDIQTVLSSEIKYVNNELKILKNNYIKLSLCDGENEVLANTMYTSVQDFIAKAKLLKSDLSNYVAITGVPDFNPQTKTEMAEQLREGMLNFLTDLQKSNEAILVFLVENYYNGVYNYRTSIEIVQNVYTYLYLNVNNIVILCDEVFALSDMDRLITASSNPEAGSFVEAMSQIDVKTIICDETYYDTLTEVEKSYADNFCDYLNQTWGV